MGNKKRKLAPSQQFYGLHKTDVAVYFNRIKVAFADDKDKSTKFQRLLKDYKAQKIETDDFIKGAMILFERHPNLLLGLNAFLPKNKEFAVDIFLQPLEQECLDFITKMKDISRECQKSFLKIMKRYRGEEITRSELIETVTSLLHDHDNLLLEFKGFIPSEADVRNGAGFQSNEENFALEGPRKKMKLTKENFPDLVFNKEILFFEKAKAKLQSKGASFGDLLKCLNLFGSGEMISHELQSKVRAMWPDLAKDVDELFVLHDKPSYLKLTTKAKHQRHTSFMKDLGKEVLNDFCQLRRTYEDKAKNPKKNRVKKAWERDFSRIGNWKDDKREEIRFDCGVKKHINQRTIEAINRVMSEIRQGSYANFNELLKGLNFATIQECCDSGDIAGTNLRLEREDANVLPSILRDINIRQRCLDDCLIKITEFEHRKWKEGRRNTQAIPVNVKSV